MKFRKTSRTPFLQNTSSGCFCQKRPQHKCLPVKFAKFFRTSFFNKTPAVATSEWTLLSSKMRNNKNQHDFWFLVCFKDIFDSRILFPELVAETKHYLFGFDAIQFFLSNQCFCLLITTIQNIYISNETSQKEKEKQLYKLKGPLHLAKFAIANIVHVLAQMICKVERSKIHIAKVKKFWKWV